MWPICNKLLTILIHKDRLTPTNDHITIMKLNDLYEAMFLELVRHCINKDIISLFQPYHDFRHILHYVGIGNTNTIHVPLIHSFVYETSPIYKDATLWN